MHSRDHAAHVPAAPRAVRRLNWRGRAWAVRAGAASVAVTLLAADAYARAGGGGNFGGGGGGGGGHGWGGGSGHGSGGVDLLLWLIIRHPAIGIPIVLLVLYLMYRRGVQLRVGYQTTVLRDGARAARANVSDDLGGRLLAHDPSFDPAAFDARVRTAFVKAQEAWCAQDLTAIRPFVSDGVHERFSMQLEEQRALGYRDHIDGLQIDRTSIVHCELEGAFETVTVRIVATAADYRVSLTGGARVGGDVAPQRMVEFWTFLRRRGAKSVAKGEGLLEGRCPNCGDSVEGNQFADCKICHARLRSGDFDWVLAEIAQAGEWTPAPRHTRPGVLELAAADREFSVEAMEDRASVAFWRWATATRTGDAAPLAVLASDGVFRAVAASVAEDDGTRRYVGECGVGGVELLGVLREDGVDRAVMDVHWSGTEFEVRGGGAPKRLARTGVRSWLLVFERKSGVKTRVVDSFSSAHCRGCGGPAEGTSRQCVYCGTSLVDADAGWSLAQMTTRNEAAGKLVLDRLRAAPSGPAPAGPSAALPPAAAGLLAWAARVAASDGVVDPKERAALVALAERNRIPAERVDEIVRDALTPGTEAPEPQSVDDARVWLEAAVRAAVADGVVTPEEFALLRRLGEPARMSPADVRILMNRVKAQAYMEARAAIQRAKAG